MRRKLTLTIGIAVVLISALMYFFKNHYWFYPAVVGMWLVFDTLSFFRGNKTTLGLIIEKKYKKFIIIYLSLLFFGTIIEIFGRLLLGLWVYPFIESPFLIIFGQFLYPFILMSFREMYMFVESFVDNKISAVILSMIMGIIIWEIPVIFSKDWIYIIPFLQLELFGLNLIVIAGWLILILGPVYIYNLVEKLKI